MSSGDNRRIDPITLTVIWNSLISIADEMSGALRRTAFSEAVREGEDGDVERASVVVDDLGLEEGG